MNAGNVSTTTLAICQTCSQELYVYLQRMAIFARMYSAKKLIILHFNSWLSILCDYVVFYGIS